MVAISAPWALTARALTFFKSVQSPSTLPNTTTNTGAVFAETESEETLTADILTSRAVKAIDVLNTNYYNPQTGIWDDAWWNSANALTTLADFASINGAKANDIDIGGTLWNTYEKAQQVTVSTSKALSETGMVMSLSGFSNATKQIENAESSGRWGKGTGMRRKRGFEKFINDFYDDEGWWALGLIRAYDVTREQSYLDSAVTIFHDMQTGLGGPCGGGVYWSKERKYVNAVTNELYLTVAASLANRIDADAVMYRDIAWKQWQWFLGSGMINEKGLINDGLTSKCENNNMNTWTYNQGVILGGLVELHKANAKALASGESSPVNNDQNDWLLIKATRIARAAIKHLSNSDGILIEADKCEKSGGKCGKDGQQFKGVFVRNLRYLHEVKPQKDFRSFILKQAQGIWKEGNNGKGELGVAWAGPFRGASGPSQSSALDAVVAAMAVV